MVWLWEPAGFIVIPVVEEPVVLLPNSVLSAGPPPIVAKDAATLLYECA
jgi:hypothetical protein